ncbi:hypothetical protein CRUP_014852, partial [Coryphaenoides rupestris]
AMSFEAHNLTVPSVMWLGLLPSDLQRLRVPQDVLIPLTQRDESKLDSLLKRPYLASQPSWQREMDLMRQNKLKAEIQSLSAIGPDFLSSIYLPNKLHYGAYYHRSAASPDMFHRISFICCFKVEWDVFRSRFSHVDTFRCPFLSVTPSTLQRSAGHCSLLCSALKCPVMMELASSLAVRELSSSSSSSSSSAPVTPDPSQTNTGQ